MGKHSGETNQQQGNKKSIQGDFGKEMSTPLNLRGKSTLQNQCQVEFEDSRK